MRVVDYLLLKKRANGNIYSYFLVFASRNSGRKHKKLPRVLTQQASGRGSMGRGSRWGGETSHCRTSTTGTCDLCTRNTMTRNVRSPPTQREGDQLTPPLQGSPTRQAGLSCPRASCGHPAPRSPRRLPGALQAPCPLRAPPPQGLRPSTTLMLTCFPFSLQPRNPHPCGSCAATQLRADSQVRRGDRWSGGWRAARGRSCPVPALPPVSFRIARSGGDGGCRLPPRSHLRGRVSGPALSSEPQPWAGLVT